MKLQEALKLPLWVNHKIGDVYSMRNRDGNISSGWKIAYYPLFQTLKNGCWIELDEPRALIERPLNNGTDFREVPIRFLTQQK